MLLPNAEHASIDIRKLAEYSPDPTHPVGRHKSIVFRSALGLTAAMIYGQRYTVDFPASTASGSAMLRSAWIVRPDEDFRRLTTCFVLPS